MDKLKQCPFCGNDLNKQDPIDTIYLATKPNGNDRMVWQIVCQEHYGGCSATILGYSKEECIKKWNREPEDDCEGDF